MLNSCVPRCSKILKVIVSHAQKINMFREMISVCVYSEWGEKVYCFEYGKSTSVCCVSFVFVQDLELMLQPLLTGKCCFFAKTKKGNWEKHGKQ